MDADGAAVHIDDESEAGFYWDYRVDWGSKVSVTSPDALATLATAWATAKFLPFTTNTAHPDYGMHRLCVPDACFAAGELLTIFFGATVGKSLPIVIKLKAFDPDTAAATPAVIATAVRDELEDELELILDNIDMPLTDLPTAAECATAVQSSFTTTPAAVNVKKVNSITIQGAGTSGDKWRPV